MPFLTIAGENKLAQNQSVNGGLNIVSFVLANIPNLGAEPVDRIAALPDPSLIVDTLPFTKRGYVNPNQVVYSLVMGSNVGDYDFNWIGLVDADGVLVAVSHIPTIQKRKNVGGIPGNTITRNFLLKYTGIQEITATTVPVETWQIDFSDRLNGIDERERLANLDVYGHEGFLADGWKVTGANGTYSVAAGIGYVGGVRAKNSAPQEITTATFPNEIWLNVSLQGDISDMKAVAEFVIDTGPFADYVDGNGIEHYLTKIATIDATGGVKDVRQAPSLDSFRSYIEKIRKDDLYHYASDFFSSQGRKNLLVNGQFQVWQRGQSFSSTGYTADQWYAVMFNSIVTNDDGSLLVSTNANYGGAEIHQHIEADIVKKYRGKELTFSVKLAFLGYLGGCRLDVAYSDETDARDAVLTGVATRTFSISQSSWYEHITFSVPNNAVGLRVSIVPMEAQQMGSKMWLHNAQLEVGSMPTEFEFRHETDELMLCKRYGTLEVLNSYLGLGNLFIYSGGLSGGVVYHLSVPLRAAPSMTIKTGNVYIGNGVPQQLATSVSVNPVNKYSTAIGLSVTWQTAVSSAMAYTNSLSFFLDASL